MVRQTYGYKIRFDLVVDEMRKKAMTSFCDHAAKAEADKERIQEYINACSAYHVRTSTSLTFTRDIGGYAAGIFTHPDCERCWHLSLCFKSRAGRLLDFDKPTALDWAMAFFDEADVEHFSHKLAVAEPIDDDLVRAAVLVATFRLEPGRSLIERVDDELNEVLTVEPGEGGLLRPLRGGGL